MSHKSPDTLKQLKTQETKHLAELQAAKAEQAAASQRVTFAMDRLSATRREITKAVPKCITVTDHAMLRLLERKYDIPVDRLRDSVAERVQKFGGLGDGRFPIGDGMRAVVKDGTVVTVLPK